MLREPIGSARSECRQQQTGQHEVVCPEPAGSEARVGRVLVMDLGEDSEAEWPGDIGHPVEEVVYVWLHHEAGRAGLLDDVANGVETYDSDAAVGQKLQPVGDQSTGRLGGDVQIDLLGPISGTERCPDPFLLAGFLDSHARERRIRLP